MCIQCMRRLLVFNPSQQCPKWICWYSTSAFAKPTMINPRSKKQANKVTQVLVFPLGFEVPFHFSEVSDAILRIDQLITQTMPDNHLSTPFLEWMEIGVR